jgi:hypothetical protein
MLLPCMGILSVVPLLIMTGTGSDWTSAGYRVESAERYRIWISASRSLLLRVRRDGIEAWLLMPGIIPRSWKGCYNRVRREMTQGRVSHPTRREQLLREALYGSDSLNHAKASPGQWRQFFLTLSPTVISEVWKVEPGPEKERCALSLESVCGLATIPVEFPATA